MILIALMLARIPPGPDDFKRVTKYQTFKTSSYCDLNQWQTLYSRLRLILGRDLFKVIRL